MSARRCGGDLLRTLCTVLNKTDRASLWKQMITLVVVKLVGYFLCFLRHLKQTEKINRYVPMELSLKQYWILILVERNLIWIICELADHRTQFTVDKFTCKNNVTPQDRMRLVSVLRNTTFRRLKFTMTTQRNNRLLAIKLTLAHDNLSEFCPTTYDHWE